MGAEVVKSKRSGDPGHDQKEVTNNLSWTLATFNDHGGSAADAAPWPGALNNWPVQPYTNHEKSLPVINA
jgi:hypothetical protein